MSEWISDVIEWLVHFVHEFGYVGIFIMTFLEGSFLPIPSEITMVPAGYLVHQGKMNFWIVWFAAIMGTICGALVNYYIAAKYGRPFLIRYGKYFMINEEKFNKMERFIKDHGEISMFTGRLLPGIRNLITFPAGVLHMHLKPFCIYSGLGGALWTGVLLGVGYLIGDNEALVKRYMPYIIISVLALGVLGLLIYIRIHNSRRRNRKNTEGLSE